MSATTIAEFAAKLGLDIDAQAFARGQGSIEMIRSGLRYLKRAAIGAFDITKDVAHYADTIDEAAQRTGIGTTALQELAYAAGFSSIELGDLGQSMGFLSRSMFAAQHGSKEARRSFAELGIQVTDGSGQLRAADQILGDVADRFSGMEDGAEKTALAMRLFGRGGGQMIPFLNAGRAGIQKLRDEAEELGIVLDESTIKTGVEASDSMDQLGHTWTGLKRILGAALLPELVKATKAMTAWVKANRDAIRSGISSVVGVVSTAFHALWEVLKFVAPALELVFKNMDKVALVAGGLMLRAIVQATAAFVTAGTAGAAAGIKAAAAWLLAFAPWLGLALLIEDVWVAINGGDSVVGRIIEKVKDLYHWIQKAIDKFHDFTVHAPVIGGDLTGWAKQVMADRENDRRMKPDVMFAEHQELAAQVVRRNAGLSQLTSNRANAPLISVPSAAPSVSPETAGRRVIVKAGGQFQAAPVNVVINAGNADAQQTAEHVRRVVREENDRALREAEGGSH